jgi:hypothetical protein
VIEDQTICSVAQISIDGGKEITMNNRKDEAGDSTSPNNSLEANHSEGRNGALALDDLEPLAEIKGGSLPGNHTVTDVTLKRGIVG